MYCDFKSWPNDVKLYQIDWFSFEFFGLLQLFFFRLGIDGQVFVCMFFLLFVHWHKHWFPFVNSSRQTETDGRFLSSTQTVNGFTAWQLFLCNRWRQVRPTNKDRSLYIYGSPYPGPMHRQKNPGTRRKFLSKEPREICVHSGENLSSSKIDRLYRKS